MRTKRLRINETQLKNIIKRVIKEACQNDPETQKWMDKENKEHTDPFGVHGEHHDDHHNDIDPHTGHPYPKRNRLSMHRSKRSGGSLNENRLNKIITESIKKVLKESADYQELANAIFRSNGKYDNVLQAMYEYAVEDDPSGIQDSWTISQAFEMMGQDADFVSDEEYDNMAETIRKAANYLENMGVFNS